MRRRTSQRKPAGATASRMRLAPTVLLFTLAAPAVAADVMPTGPKLVIVERAADRQPLIMAGFVVSGEAVAMAAVEGAAAKAGLPTDRKADDGGVPETFVAFPPGTDREAALTLYRTARAGGYGKLKVSVGIVPVAAVTKGADIVDKLAIADPAVVAGP